MNTKIYKKSDKPCKWCVAISRKGAIELHCYSSVRRYFNASFHYLEEGYTIYCYKVSRAGVLWYHSAHCASSQPFFDMALTRLTGLVIS